MWLKQLQLFQLSENLSYDASSLSEQLAPYAFQPCLPSLAASQGWISPFKTENGPLVHGANGVLLFCLQTEEKVLPASVIRQELEDKIKDLELKQDRKISKKEKLNLRDEITQSLLIKAFSKFSHQYCYIDTKNNWLVTDIISANKFERFLHVFNRSFPALSLKPLELKKPGPVLTNWLLNNSFPAELSCETSCVLRDSQNQSRLIRATQQDLFSENILGLIKDGCEVQQLLLNWQDRLMFTLTDEFIIKSIKYGEEVLDLAKDNYSETAEQRFDADFMIMSETITQLIQDLVKLFKSDNKQDTLGYAKEALLAV